MDREQEALEAGGAVGERAGVGLGQAVRRGQAATRQPADASLRQRALLGRYGALCGRAWARYSKRGARGPSPVAAHQHLRSERATLQLDVQWGRIFPEGPSSGWSKDSSFGGVSGNGAGRRNKSCARFS